MQKKMVVKRFGIGYNMKQNGTFLFKMTKTRNRPLSLRTHGKIATIFPDSKQPYSKKGGKKK